MGKPRYICDFQNEHLAAFEGRADELMDTIRRAQDENAKNWRRLFMALQRDGKIDASLAYEDCCLEINREAKQLFLTVKTSAPPKIEDGKAWCEDCQDWHPITATTIPIPGDLMETLKRVFEKRAAPDTDPETMN
jgi:hypothetical protein